MIIYNLVCFLVKEYQVDGEIYIYNFQNQEFTKEISNKATFARSKGYEPNYTSLFAFHYLLIWTAYIFTP